MINLRYHIVSLVAVFLALGIGVVMGSTVIDRAIVDTLNKRVNRVEKSVSAAQAENRRLNGQLDTVRSFADQARDQITKGHLKGVPVVVLAVQGIDRRPVDDVRDALVNAEADLAGTVWFTPKMRVAGDADARVLADAVDLPPDRPDAVRRAALIRLATVFAGTSPDPSPLPALAAAGFVAYEPPAPAAPAGSSVPPAGGPPPRTVADLHLADARMVLVSGAGASVGDEQLAVPLAGLLAASGTPLVAAEAGQDSPGGRAVFVGLLRSDSRVTDHLSTVDDLESPMGQAATVLALDDLGAHHTGHFGVGPGAQRLLPPAPA